MTQWVGSLLVLLIAGCSGPASQPASSPEPQRSPPSSVEKPVTTCGPKEAYEYVASFRCADGQSPFAGDLRRAAEARRGSRQSPSSDHLIDVYEVPCKSGQEIVYVDLYGCPEYEQQLAALGAAPEAVPDRFARGDFEGVIARCRSLDGDAENGERAWCAGLSPAAQHALGRDEEALAQIGEICRRMPQGPDNDARASLIALVMLGLAEAAREGRFQRDDAQRSALLARWTAACGVTDGDVQGAVDRMERGE